MTDMLDRRLAADEMYFPSELPSALVEPNTADTEATNSEALPLTVDEVAAARNGLNAALAHSYLGRAPESFAAADHDYTNAGAAIVAFSSRYDR